MRTGSQNPAMTSLPAELTAFLHGELDAASFGHADHVRMAFEVLRRHPFLEAALAVERSLKTMAAKAGAPGAYHATITVAFLALIDERRARCPDTLFETFSAANPDLFDRNVLKRWYGAKLGEPVARQTFVLPEPTA
jgi:hypothetical protein